MLVAFLVPKSLWKSFFLALKFPFQVLSDGKSMIPLIAAQDHKRVYEKDEGPNTGGMGAYAPLPFLDKETQQKIEHTLVLPTLLGLQGEQIDYRGVLYFGIMLTSEGPKLLEYNCRFGDPEAQTILPLLRNRSGRGNDRMHPRRNR